MTQALTADEITTIHHSHAVLGDTYSRLANRYNVSESTIGRHVRRIEEEIEAQTIHGVDRSEARRRAYEGVERRE